MKNYLLFLCLTFGMLSCQNEDEPLKQEEGKILEKQKISESECIFQMAAFINDAIKDKRVLEILKEEAGRQVDGDYDILLAQALDDNSPNTRNGKNLLDLISLSLQPRYQIRGGNFLNFVNILKKEVPLLNIYMPDDQDFSNMSDFLTIILPSDFKDGKDQTVKAFNSKGEIVEVSSLEDPDVPYMVVGINERFDLSPKLPNSKGYNIQTPLFRTEYHNYYLSESFVKKDQ